MIKTVLVVLSTVILTGMLIISCNSPADKLENAENKMDDASQKLEEETQNYLMEVEAFKKSTEAQIAANEKSIIELNAKAANQKPSTKAEYELKIAELNKKNSDMKLKLAGFDTRNQSEWAQFKRDFNRDMDELGQAFKNLAEKN